MDVPFQRVGALSNTQVGMDFEQVARACLAEKGIDVQRRFAVPVGVGDVKKPRSFDLGSEDPPVFVECKSHRWTAGKNSPSAKLTVWNEAMYYFTLAPPQYRRILFVLRNYFEKGRITSRNRHKGRTRQAAIEDRLKALQDAGLDVCSFAVNGLPDQTPDQMRESVHGIADLIDRGLLQASYLFGLVPYPGSDLFDNPQHHDMEFLHHDYSLYHEDMPPVYRTPRATPDEVFAVFEEGLDWLRDAMSRRPPPPLTAEQERGLGNFWSQAHV